MRKISVAVLVISVMCASIALGQEKKTEPAKSSTPTVDEVVNRTNEVSYYKGKDGRAKVSMTITDSQGRKREREFVILRRDEPPKEAGEKDDDKYCGDQKFYIFFNRPPDVNKMVFLVWKHIDKEDDRWLYLPALDLVKRISASDKRTSFVGSNFFYEDVSGRSITEDTHELLDTTDSFYVLKNVPKDTESVEFAYFKIWVHKASFLPVKIEYFDKNDEKYREYEALKVENIQGFPTVVKASMKDLRNKENTVLEYEDVKYNIDLPESIFTERYLRKAPKKYLK
ncbi:outer membrane lipoprotein-sorting protein [Candidatus Hydrogenedentota bacterium]